MELLVSASYKFLLIVILQIKFFRVRRRPAGLSQCHYNIFKFERFIYSQSPLCDLKKVS